MRQAGLVWCSKLKGTWILFIAALPLYLHLLGSALLMATSTPSQWEENKLFLFNNDLAVAHITHMVLFISKGGWKHVVFLSDWPCTWLKIGVI